MFGRYVKTNNLYLCELSIYRYFWKNGDIKMHQFYPFNPRKYIICRKNLSKNTENYVDVFENSAFTEYYSAGQHYLNNGEIVVSVVKPIINKGKIKKEELMQILNNLNCKVNKRSEKEILENYLKRYRSYVEKSIKEAGNNNLDFIYESLILFGIMNEAHEILSPYDEVLSLTYKDEATFENKKRKTLSNE